MHGRLRRLWLPVVAIVMVVANVTPVAAEDECDCSEAEALVSQRETELQALSELQSLIFELQLLSNELAPDGDRNPDAGVTVEQAKEMIDRYSAVQERVEILDRQMDEVWTRRSPVDPFQLIESERSRGMTEFSVLVGLQVLRSAGQAISGVLLSLQWGPRVLAYLGLRLWHREYQDILDDNAGRVDRAGKLVRQAEQLQERGRSSWSRADLDQAIADVIEAGRRLDEAKEDLRRCLEECRGCDPSQVEVDEVCYPRFVPITGWITFNDDPPLPSIELACESQRLRYAPEGIPEPPTPYSGWGVWSCNWRSAQILPTIVTAACPDSPAWYVQSDQPNLCVSRYHELQPPTDP